jgi:hypothetical protein
MIQRLQSVLLLLAAIANFAAFFLPYGYGSVLDSMDAPHAKLYGGNVVIESLIDDPGPGETFGEWKKTVLAVGDDALLTVHGLLLGLNSIALIAMIFMYQNRSRQVRLVYVGILMLMGQIVIAAAMIWTRMPVWLGATELPESALDTGPQFGFFIPVVAVLLLWWAVKRIQKDDKMVRDMDRIR